MDPLAHRHEADTYKVPNTFGKVAFGVGIAFAAVAVITAIAAAILALPFAPLAGVVGLLGLTVAQLTVGSAISGLIALCALALSAIFGKTNVRYPEAVVHNNPQTLKELDEARIKNEKLETEVAELSKKRDEAVKTSLNALQTWEGKEKAYKEQLRKAQEESKLKENLLEGWAKKEKEVSARMKELETDLAAAAKPDTLAEIATLKDTVKKLQEERTALLEKIQKATDADEGLTRELEAHRAEVLQLKDKISQLSNANEVDRLNGEIENIKREHLNKLKEMADKIEDIISNNENQKLENNVEKEKLRKEFIDQKEELSQRLLREEQLTKTLRAEIGILNSRLPREEAVA